MNADGRGGKKYSYRDFRHIVRLGVLLVVGFSASIAARYAAVPATYYEKGRYRGAAPEKIASWNARFAGQESCVECHTDKGDVVLAGRHTTLHCETCHWASRDHAEDPNIEPRMKVKAEGMREFCSNCHAQKIGRPAGFPQIDLADHNPDEPCSTCHQPHSPEVK